MSGYHLDYSGLGVLLALLCLLTLPFVLLYRRKRRRPWVYFSQVGDLPQEPGSSLRQKAVKWPNYLFVASLVFFALSLANIRLLMPPLATKKGSQQEAAKQAKVPREGIALYLVVDISGSMARKVPYSVGEELPTFLSKIDLMKQLTEKFLLGDEQLELPGRPSDLVGLVVFARKADILIPLTLDHQAVVEKLRGLQTVVRPEDDGTGIGYAIYKTASTIAATRRYAESLPAGQRPAYTVLGSAIILVTDGFQSPNDLDKGNWLRAMGMEDAAEYARAQGIKVYLVDIEPSLAQPEFEPHRNLLTRVAEKTGGKFFLAQSLDELPEIYRTIDALEKGVIPGKDTVSVARSADSDQRIISFYPILVILGMLCMAAAVCLESLWLKVTP